MAWHYSLTFDPQGAFLCMCSVSLVRKEEGGRSLNPSLTHGFVPFVLALTPAMTITLTCLQKTNLAIYPVSVVTSILEGKQEANLNTLTGPHRSFVSGNVNSSK